MNKIDHNINSNGIWQTVGHRLTGGIYGTRHLAKIFRGPSSVKEKLGHFAIGTLECIPILGSVIAAVEGKFFGVSLWKTFGHSFSSKQNPSEKAGGDLGHSFSSKQNPSEKTEGDLGHSFSSKQNPSEKAEGDLGQSKTEKVTVEKGSKICEDVVILGIPETMQIAVEECNPELQIMGLSGRDCLQRIGFVKNSEGNLMFSNTDIRRCTVCENGFRVSDPEGNFLCKYDNGLLNLSYTGLASLRLPIDRFSLSRSNNTRNFNEIFTKQTQFCATIDEQSVQFSYIGGGSFGKAYRGNLPSGQTVIMKIIGSVERFSVIEALNEYHLQEKAAGTGAPIVKTISVGLEVCESQTFVCLLMEDAGEKNLQEITASGKPFAPQKDYSIPTEKRALKALISMLRQLFEGCDGLARTGVVHRDLKPENLFCDSENHLKIGDFGFATEASFHRQDCWGTREYMAPETLALLGGDKTSIPCQTSATDIYAAGLIVHQCITGDILYNPLNSLDLGEANRRFRINTDITVKEEVYRLRKIFPPISEQLVGLVNGCCKKDPNNRLTARKGVEILQTIETLLDEGKTP